jgi:hypothetical protein
MKMRSEPPQHVSSVIDLTSMDITNYKILDCKRIARTNEAARRIQLSPNLVQNHTFLAYTRRPYLDSKVYELSA